MVTGLYTDTILKIVTGGWAPWVAPYISKISKRFIGSLAIPGTHEWQKKKINFEVPTIRNHERINGYIFQSWPK